MAVQFATQNHDLLNLVSPQGALQGTTQIPQSGNYWEHGNDSDIHEIIPDHFLNWVGNASGETYITATPDQYNAVPNPPSYVPTANDLHIEAYWVGGIDVVIGKAHKGKSPGIKGFAQAAVSQVPTGYNLLSTLDEVATMF